MINIDESEDWKKFAWFIKSYVRVESVSKLNGRRIKVRGSSLVISIKTNKTENKIGFFNIGMLILNIE